MLNGQELLNLVAANPNTPQRELARRAGYVRMTKNEKEYVLEKRFYNALLAAKGMKLGTERRTGKAANFVASVQQSGVVVVGAAYTKKFGLTVGDQLQIVLGDEAIELRPLPVEIEADVAPAACPAPGAAAGQGKVAALAA